MSTLTQKPASRRSVPRWSSAVQFAGVFLGIAGMGCTNPLQEGAIADLGPESPAIPLGPLHRPGQPCLVCHDGAEATELTVAGTIYERADATKPIPDVLVHLVDARGTAYVTATNCAGNFFVRPGDFTPEYPMRVAIERDGFRQEMESPVNVDGSCASCHTNDPSPRSAGRVYLLSVAATLEDRCP
ncbi:carboxypeptidase regulatory-like domain-containing protein [Polyangium fumosum]|uniref:Carboxypeptidase regulatory-like domain-containing protein n=1 Tax=Polyangium fumosum TaxID=889272 RepID=A0A4U1IX09_9BACT|nr:carboxypeptidase regulatory-like domain-containing protein [Polyangium fumosum]TKC99011.1 carboxypeptidase regulatory-like domain-containing protein [Polyangium fumosum]